MNANENFLASDSDYNLEKKQKRNKKKRRKVKLMLCQDGTETKFSQ